MTVLDAAVLQGLTEMADLLRRFGAVSSGAASDRRRPSSRRACGSIGRPRRRCSTRIRSSGTRHRRCSRRRRAIGRTSSPCCSISGSRSTSPTTTTRERCIMPPGQRPARAAFLIERGARSNPHESHYGGTPIDWAAHGEHQPMMDFLSAYSRNVGTLTFRGYVDRLRDVLRGEPGLARVLDSDGDTPLWWLPDDERRRWRRGAAAGGGVDPATKNRAGRTAADWARKRGMIRRRTPAGVRDRRGHAAVTAAGARPPEVRQPRPGFRVRVRDRPRRLDGPPDGILRRRSDLGRPAQDRAAAARRSSARPARRATSRCLTRES